jgi:hypothetical protein
VSIKAMEGVMREFMITTLKASKTYAQDECVQARADALNASRRGEAPVAYFRFKFNCYVTRWFRCALAEVQ